ncbi:MAG: hypothetical protein A3H31_10500 [Gallionellales bacterium RIFCSPLOWO2_02_FULL_57_47]|jgi:uncharacterized Zn finger protein (UPF0148 family)|nr:MAG: hypothetical protein A3H31_10500 [Gallionellales bacterium RIFCSPLOWO2_02_FULL_57_47]
MTTPDKDQTGNTSRKSGYEDTVTLQRCPRHGIPFMAHEGCPECEKEKEIEKDSPASKGAG